MILPITLPQNDNTGIVPPWLANPGATPSPTPRPGRNPGIVPPWLQGPGAVQPIAPTHPVGGDVPQIFGLGAPTAFDPTPVDPEQPHILPIG